MNISTRNYIFIADRGDGFGARMSAVLNALSVAEYYGAQCRIIWREKARVNYHSVGSSDAIFSKDFNDRYCGNYNGVSSIISFSQFIRRYESVESRPVSGDEPIFVKVGLSVPDAWLAQVGADVFRGLLKSSYKKIEFSPDLQDVVAVANSIELGPETAAVHLRAGDMIYGQCRYSLLLGRKAVPYQLAAAFLERCSRENRPAVLFGQDAELCRNLALSYNVMLADNLVDKNNWTSFQREIFDVTLISRCATAFGGESRFLQLGAAAAGQPLQTIYEIFNEQERKEIILADDVPTNVKQVASAQQQTYALWMAAGDILKHDDFDAREALPIVEKALAIAGDDGFLIFARACLLAKSGDFAGAEAALQAFASDSIRPIGVFLRTRPLPIRFLSNFLIAAADRGFPWASAFLLIEGGEQLPNAAKYAKNAEAYPGVSESNWADALASQKRHSSRAARKRDLQRRRNIARRMKAQQEDILSLKKKLKTTRRKLDLVARKNKQMRQSISWKISAPLRWITKIGRRKSAKNRGD